MGKTTWTDEQHARLVELAAEQMPTRQIASQLGITRNAVIGRARRTGVKLADPPPRRVRGAMRRKKRGGKDDAFRIAALCSVLTGESASRAAKRLHVSEQSIANWRRDPDLMARATALAARVRTRWGAEQEAARLAALAAAEIERARVEAHNAPVLARASLRERNMMRRRVAGETLLVIADDYGVSRERVRQIEVKWRVDGLIVPHLRPLNMEAAERLLTRLHIGGRGRKPRKPKGLVKDDAYWASKVAQALRDVPIEVVRA